jgi:hypothetical protein
MFWIIQKIIQIFRTVRSSYTIKQSTVSLNAVAPLDFLFEGPEMMDSSNKLLYSAAALYRVTQRVDRWIRFKINTILISKIPLII